MIDELMVRNLGVIESARLEPCPGLTVITGETGAGKTLLLGALRLLLGGDARSDLVGPFGDEATAEGRFFTVEGAEVGAARRLPRDGRSRAYLDGSIASARALEERIAGLVDVIGQHDQLSLTRPPEVRALVDRALDEEGRTVLADYRRSWESLTEAKAARERLGGDRAALARELDLVRYQAEEIADAGFDPGEDDTLQIQADRLRHADEIAELAAAALRSLDNGREEMGDAVAALRRAAALDPSLDPLSVQLAASSDGIADLSLEIRTTAESVERDPTTLELLDSRLTSLGELKRKYGNSLTEILRFGAEAEKRRAELEALLARAEAIDGEVSKAELEVAEAGARLRERRRAAGEVLAERARGHLLGLGFSDPSVHVTVEETGPHSAGADVIGLEFASDSRLQAGPVASVASGGELSRLVLALRLAGGSGESETLVFDEVDSGIGGATALALGEKLGALASDRQVLCVTHLPQLAAFAERHYVVRRTGTTAGLERVEGEERVEELARMLAGLPESERGREAATELLEMAARV